jgi:hypothetical protein
MSEFKSGSMRYMWCEGSDYSPGSTGDQSWISYLLVRNELGSNSILLPVENGKGTRKGLLGFDLQVLA